MKLSLLALLAVAASGRPVDLRCDYLANPLGIDNPAPQFSWRSNDTARNWKQSAYQIVVASSAAALRGGKADVWDSGRQPSAESIGIAYGGPKLEARRRYYWNVRVWDGAGTATEAAEPAWWEMGLLSTADWNAKWITRNDPEAVADLAGIRWIWVAGQNALAVPVKTVATFRLEVSIPTLPANAALYLLARGAFKAKVNGRDAGSKDSRFQEFDRQDITELLVAGKNAIEVTVTVAGGGDGPPGRPAPANQPAALAALLKIRRADGTIERFPTDAHWQAGFGAASAPAGVVAELADKRLGSDPGSLPGPAALLRREFPVSRQVKAARLYVTALGSYRMFLNGKRVGQDVLTPEYTDYSKRITYQTYDVGPMLARGRNAIGAMLGDGWFASGMTWTGMRFSYGPAPTRLLAHLRIDYRDGSHETVVTDETWKTFGAPVLHSEIYAGEVYDSRLEQPGWEAAGYNDASWNAAVAADVPRAALSSAVTLPPRITESLKPRAITSASNGAYIVDMGQNMVGWLKLKAIGAAGTKIRLRFAEILSPDGTLYVENLRNANVTDAWYLRGGGEETWSPNFTFHGFRYAEISGYPGKLTADKVTGEVITSAHTLTGKLTTSSDLVNRMWQVGLWGQRGNFLSVPTDCPQRDERLGWTGDAQVFWRTGAYNADIAAFGRKWMRDVSDGQTPEGAFGNTAPGMPSMPGMGAFLSNGAPGWGDAGVIVPWTAWQQYGDKGIIRENWDAMARWMKYIGDANPDLLRKNKVGPNFADWLAPDNRTQRDLVATAYWALIADMMSQMAGTLDKRAEAKQYAELHSGIRSAFQKAYIKDNGEVGAGTQTSYVLALHMKLVPEPLRTAVVDHLVKEIEAHGWHLTTGFLGTPHLLFALADNGRTDIAYKLLLTDTFPSWGYMIKKGATTWWERWNSDSGDPAMNSFNHYAFGSVVAWVYRYVAGIDTNPKAPGFREIVTRPRVGGPITQARGEYDSVYGKVISDWSTGADGALTLRVTVPANTTATLQLAAKQGAQVTEGGKVVQTHGGPDGTLVTSVGSGSYEFRVN